MPVADRISCDRCGWELRSSDIHCSLCGLPQRTAEVEPETLSLTSPSAGTDAEIQALSPGSVHLRNSGRHSFQIIAIQIPPGLGVTTEPAVELERGFTLAVGASLSVQATRTGDLPPGEPRIRVSTSIGILQLAVRLQPVPPLHLSLSRFS